MSTVVVDAGHGGNPCAASLFVDACRILRAWRFTLKSEVPCHASTPRVYLSHAVSVVSSSVCQNTVANQPGTALGSAVTLHSARRWLRSGVGSAERGSRFIPRESRGAVRNFALSAAVQRFATSEITQLGARRCGRGYLLTTQTFRVRKTPCMVAGEKMRRVGLTGAMPMAAMCGARLHSPTSLTCAKCAGARRRRCGYCMSTTEIATVKTTISPISRSFVQPAISRWLTNTSATEWGGSPEAFDSPPAPPANDRGVQCLW